MTRKEFCQKWGSAWAAFIASPMWQDAIATAETEIGLFRVAGITDDEIEKHGHLTLKAMQAHNKLELTLATLAEKPFEFATLTEDYPDPTMEAHLLENPPKKPRKKKSP